MTIETVPNKEDLLSLRNQIKKHIHDHEYDLAKGRVQELEENLVTNNNLEDDLIFLFSKTIAKYYKKVNNYDKSSKYSRKALNLVKKLELADRDEIIECYLDHASLERDYQQYANARKVLANLLVLLDKNNWQDSFLHGLTYDSLGKVCIAEEDYENGLNYLDKALHLFREEVDGTHPVIVQATEVMSNTYIQVEEYHQAIELYQQLAESYNQLNNKVSEAEILLKTGEAFYYIDLKQARSTITDALTLFENEYNGKHMNIAKAYLMLAELDENMGDFSRSITYYKRSLDQLASFCKDDHFMVVYAYSKIGTLSLKSNQLEQAKDFLEKGLSLSTNFPKVRLQFLYALGKIYSGNKNYQKALSVFQEFLQRLEQDGRQKSKAYADTLQSIAYNFVEQNQFVTAFDYYLDAIEIYNQLSPDCPEEKGLASIRLAYCLENKQEKEIEKAENYYEVGIKSIEKARNKVVLEEALAEIIDFYSRNNNPTKQKIYEDKVVKLQLNN